MRRYSAVTAPHMHRSTNMDYSPVRFEIMVVERTQLLIVTRLETFSSLLLACFHCMFL
jgi:hypothetical protein